MITLVYPVPPASNSVLAGQIERTPKEDSPLQDLIHELTTRTSFTPNTHRTIQLNPHTSLPVKGDKALSGDSKGFLGLFATLSSKGESAQDTTSTPLYLGDIDLKELQKFQEFQPKENHWVNSRAILRNN